MPPPNKPDMNDWKQVRDVMVEQLRAQLTADTTPEVVTLMAKFEVKLKSLQDEAAFTAFNTRCAEVTKEMETFVRVEILKRLTA